VVFLEDLGTNRKKGNFEEIIRYEPFGGSGSYVNLKKTKACMLSREESNQIKWCATKEEAEAFAKTLIEPEIEIKADEIDIKININTMKYSKGKIAFKGKKGGDQIPVFSSYNMPSQIHGKVFIHKDYDIEFAEIVDFYKEYYVVRYKDSCGKYVQLGFREDVLENVPTVKDMSYEELLAECKRRYPVGTVYYCQHLLKNVKITALDFEGHTNCIRSYKAYGCIYDQGKWSEIVSLPEENVVSQSNESNLEKANRIFKVGVEGISCLGTRFTITEHSFPLKEIPRGIYDQHGMWELYNIKQGKWATIESTPQEENNYLYDQLGRKLHETYFMGIDPFKGNTNLISFDDEPMVLDTPKRVNSISTKLLVLED
jgi:hypothetical protein